MADIIEKTLSDKLLDLCKVPDCNRTRFMQKLEQMIKNIFTKVRKMKIGIASMLG